MIRPVVMMGVGVLVLCPLLPDVSAEQTAPIVSPQSVTPTSESSPEEVDFGDYTSQTLTTKAWDALKAGHHRAAETYALKCLELYEPQALQQSQSLTDFAPKEDAFDYWALNDVATCYFILGQLRLIQGRMEEAREAFHTIIERFPYAQCWDLRGWFWKVAEGASDKLTTIGTPYDFGDYRSETLTTKAWGVLLQGDHQGVELYTKKCLSLYETDATRQQSQLSDFAPKSKAFEYWALNDVATCYFILGESLLKQQRYQEARAAFERVINDFSLAQCWDPKGWFWQVAVGARDRLNRILVLTSQ